MYDRDFRHMSRIAQKAWEAGLDEPDHWLTHTTQEDVESVRRENHWVRDRDEQ